MEDTWRMREEGLRRRHTERERSVISDATMAQEENGEFTIMFSS